MLWPVRRFRRLRASQAVRDLASSVKLGPEDLVCPIFVKEGIASPEPIPSMPGVLRHTHASAVHAAKEALLRGIRGVILFGVTERKDALGSRASAADGAVQEAAKAIKDALQSQVVVFADLCLDEYTDHGHCGVLAPDGSVDNDATLERYAEIALAQAQAGVDFVAPSGMMDGQVAAIRRALDSQGFQQVGILAYSAKYASCFYGPFRDAVAVDLKGGDRKSYQMDFRRALDEAVAEVVEDVKEGADMVMVKPAMPYLDVLLEVSRRVDVPVAAYQVSGEYSMIEAAASAGWLDRDSAVMESLFCIKRAGADLILTYFALAAAEILSRA
jgi:porphobilinogen synthase